MKFKIFAQNPEDYDDQGIYIKTLDEGEPWMTETDCEEFDAILPPDQKIADLESAQEWGKRIPWIKDDVIVEFEIWP